MENNTTTKEDLLVDRKPNYLKITLNRPQVLNALTDNMLKTLKKTLIGAGGDNTICAVIITGAGRGFCVGADLSIFQEKTKKSEHLSFREVLEENFHPIVKTIHAIPQIVIAQINGPCAGAGLSLALACDMKFASREASFVASFAKVGLAPDTGSSYFISKEMGYSKALEFFLIKGKAEAQEFESLGLINKTLDTPQALDQAVESAIGQIAQLPLQAVILTKRALQFSSQLNDAREAMDYEAAVQEYLGKTSDHAEGMSAFLQKRKPIFTGH